MASKNAMAKERSIVWKEGSPTGLKGLGSRNATYHFCLQPFIQNLSQRLAIHKGFRKYWRADKMFWVHAQPYLPTVERIFGHSL